MKNKIFIITTTLLFSGLISKSQNYWDFGGNTNIGSNAILGMTAAGAFDIQFFTNNSEKIRLKSGGNVGIGTTAPNYLLHLASPSTGTAVFEQFTNGSTNATSTDGFKIGLNSSNQAELHFYESSPMLFFTNDLERMRIATNGQVGINTTNPGKMLEVLDNNIQLRLRYDATNYTDYGTNSSGYFISQPTGMRSGINTTTPGTTAFDINPNGNDDPIRLRGLRSSSSVSDVALVADGDGYVRKRTDMVNSCGGTAGYNAKFTGTKTICDGLIYEDGTGYLGIG